jgi:aryl-alcohol dehydrogenase-like predicted oxidoreductase
VCPEMRRTDATPPAQPIVESLPLRATPSASAGFGNRMQHRFASDYFRLTALGTTVSSIGLGSYLGESTDADDAAYDAAVQHAIRAGINILDTAINYRCQRSERAFGSALQQVLSSGDASRQELVICSKAGYIPLDRTPPASRDEYLAYVRREFIDPEILRAEEIVAGGHSLAPRFLRYCLAESRQNLGVRTIDLFYLHNPEQQLGTVSAAELRTRIRAAFALLEDAVSRGEIAAYGVATWDGLRVPANDKRHLSLFDLVETAKQVAGEAHHFRAIQLPINLAMQDAVRTATQDIDGQSVTVVEAASHFGLSVFGSATLMQSKLTSGLPASLQTHFPSCRTDAQRAIAFARTLPGVTTALVGMKNTDHVLENVGSAAVI